MAGAFSWLEKWLRVSILCLRDHTSPGYVRLQNVSVFCLLICLSIECQVLYSSATGASELKNMAYMSRLGLWGHGTHIYTYTHTHTHRKCSTHTPSKYACAVRDTQHAYICIYSRIVYMYIAVQQRKFTLAGCRGMGSSGCLCDFVLVYVCVCVFSGTSFSEFS